MADLVRARDAATVADMVELRLDGVADIDVAQALAARPRPAVVTCRPKWEGGRFEGSEDERRRILHQALDLGAEFVDIEWRAEFGDLVARAPERVVLSSHDFMGVPDDLAARARAMRTTGAKTIKIAVAVRRLTETLALIDIARDGNAVVIGMGDAGFSSRLLAARYGSRWTYAGHAVAPGQVPASRMVDDYGFRRVGGDTRLFGVISTNAMHSLSPVMHNAAFAAAGIDAVYVPLRPADFTDFLEYAEAMDITGASVTIPFKLDAFAAALRADDLTRTVGATNTLRRIAHDGVRGWEATNTDVTGFLAPLDAIYPGDLSGSRVSVLGAGGSARAVIVALLARGARVMVHARRREQVDGLVGDLGVAAGPWPIEPDSWDLLVNCTPLGGGDLRADSPLPGGPFNGLMVYDLTYGRGASRLVAEARAAGCLALDGLPMLIAQAERQFAWWTGQPAPAGVMEQAARTRLCD
jgi:3-dehydroquinate dehydratase/shikimate dehydrogenase